MPSMLSVSLWEDQGRAIGLPTLLPKLCGREVKVEHKNSILAVWNRARRVFSVEQNDSEDSKRQIGLLPIERNFSLDLTCDLPHAKEIHQANVLVCAFDAPAGPSSNPIL